uniref:Phage transcriptional regulator n=1 Tax=Arsenophonus nasoniae TaxID=638 RepID=D2U1B8_9GAMM|nr:phage transcriptional regulator [Arsenophonus nasoniae]
MVGRSGGALRLAGFSTTGLSIPLRLATLFDSRVRGSQELSREATAMVTTPTHAHPKFTDTYWIIPLDSAVPYGKVSFTRRDFRTFIAMFKDSRLIWAGRKPVCSGMEGN